jgi:hypothetical protein
MELVEKCIHNFNQKTEGKRPQQRPGHRWEHNIEVDLEEI